jgi:hypothetical protein
MSIPIESGENMRVSTPGWKQTGREASPSNTPSSASSSAVSFEEISPMPQMERSACTRMSKYKPVVREPSRVDEKSQKAAKIAITKKPVIDSGQKQLRWRYCCEET